MRTVPRLTMSDVFMTFPRYARRKNLRAAPRFVAVLAGRGLAFFEYPLPVPPNRAGCGTFTIGQLKIVQEAITLSVLVPFAVLYMGQPLKWDYLRAGCCLGGAVFFIFRG